jgi:hypothetical protein
MELKWLRSSLFIPKHPKSFPVGLDYALRFDNAARKVPQHTIVGHLSSYLIDDWMRANHSGLALARISGDSRTWILAKSRH